MEPLVEALRRYVMTASKLHADDTPVPVLAPGHGKPRRDDYGLMYEMIARRATLRLRRSGLRTRPIARGTSPATSAGFSRALQADAYAGFNQLYKEDGRIQEAACWAHVRRKFYDLEQAHASPIGSEALERIADLYAIEKEIRGRPPDERQQVRTNERGLCPSPYRNGSRSRLPSCPASRIRLQPSAMPSDCGRH